MSENIPNSIKSYRDLQAWQVAMELVTTTYRVTTDLPRDERYGLVAQMRRCAVSIPSNIAEGWARPTKDYVRFLHMAVGSVHELSTQSEICSLLNYTDSLSDLQELCTRSGQLLNALITSLERSFNRSKTRNNSTSKIPNPETPIPNPCS